MLSTSDYQTIIGAARLKQVAPQTVRRGHATVGSSAAGREIAIPYLVREGSEDGPCLWVNAAVHGDEVNGTLAALEFFRALEGHDIAGTVIVTPVANVLALDERRKSSSIDGLDLDQCFPGRASGFATERLAAKLFTEIGRRADVVVNLHTLSTPFDAAPYAVYKVHPGSVVSEDVLLRHIAFFQPTIACRMPVENAGGELPGNIAGALDYQTLARNAVGFMIELGGGGRIEPEVVRIGADGLVRLAAHVGLTRGATPTESTGARSVVRVTRRAHKLADKGGFFHPELAPGRAVPSGSRLGFIRNVFGDVVEEILCDRDAWIIAIRRDPVVHTGDRVAFIATDWDEVDVSG